MSNRQRPIDSPFGARSTVADVLRDVDLSGSLALVTGGYSGLGLAAVRGLVAAGAEVIVPARRSEAAQAALAGLARTRVAPLDLADLASVRRLADDLVAEGRPIHRLLLNAGIMACPETRIGPGWEAQFAVNHLGHFVLAAGLWPILADGARVVATSSGAQAITGIRWDDIHFAGGYDKWTAYGQSKTANVLFAVHLDWLGRQRGVRGYALHPGAILTPLQRHLTREEMVRAGWIDENGDLADPTFKTIEQGAATKVWAATSPLLADIGGVYCQDCNIAPVAENPGDRGVRPHAIDAGDAERLWAYSESVTGARLPP